MHSFAHTLALLFVLLAPLGCDRASSESPARLGEPAPGANAQPESIGLGASAALAEGNGPRVVFLGDSITAGLHLPVDEAFPAVLGRLLEAEGRPIRLQAAGQSGDTSAGGLRRADWVLDPPPDILVVELGGNDALRGQPLENITNNLRQIIRKGKNVGARVLLLGMRIPTSYGPAYANGFAEIYEQLAGEEEVAFIPFFMAAAVNTPGHMLSDRLHPSTRGHKALAETLLPHLRELLEQVDEQPPTEQSALHGRHARQR